MRRALGSLLLTALLAAGAAGCGDTTDTAADHGSADGTPTSAAPASGPPETVAVLSQSNAGGRVDTTATVLDGPAAVAAFADRFRDGPLAGRIKKAVARADVPSGRLLVASVVALGCDAPRTVEVQKGPDGLKLTAQPVRSPRQECFVPVTTVAVVSVDDSLV